MEKLIYGIKDLRTQKFIYVGVTKDLQYRWCRHKSDKNMNIGRYMMEEGIDNFNVEILEENVEDYLHKENYYIELYDTINNGFNKYLSGGLQSKKFKEERKKNKELRKQANQKIAEEKHQHYLEMLEHRKEIQKIIDDEFNGNKEEYYKWKGHQYYLSNRKRIIERVKNHKKSEESTK